MPVEINSLSDLYLEKEKKLFTLFHDSIKPEQIYQTIIALGKTLQTYPDEFQNETYLVKGCQSLVYLCSHLDSEGRMQYRVKSDALISAGLAALLLFIYNEEPPELILYNHPQFIQNLGLHQSLTPGRSNGLAGMYAKMKQDALKLFISNKVNNQ